MRVTDLYSKKSPVISMEFFPPRDAAAMEKFNGIVNKLADHEPDYMSVTFGAGGSTRDGSYQTVKMLIKDKKMPAVAYIAGYGLGPDEISAVLDSYQSLGVETIFVIRGDQPRDKKFTPHPESFSYASDLIRFIRQRYSFTLGCAGYPEGHQEAESPAKDIDYLKVKQDNGAEYVIAQYCYDNRYFFDYVDKCRAAGITAPIIPGIMPVYTIKLTNILAKVCGATITSELKKILDAMGDADEETVLKAGIDFAVDQCRGLLAKDVPGLHFYTMNRDRSTSEILNRLKQNGDFQSS